MKWIKTSWIYSMFKTKTRNTASNQLRGMRNTSPNWTEILSYTLMRGSAWKSLLFLFVDFYKMKLVVETTLYCVKLNGLNGSTRMLLQKLTCVKLVENIFQPVFLSYAGTQTESKNLRKKNALKKPQPLVFKL